MSNAMRTPAGAISVERYQGAVAEGRFRRLWNANAPGYLFLLPWLVGFFGLTLGPALISLYLSFTDYDMLQSPRWVGMANYVRIATADPKFSAAMDVTLTYVVFSVPFKLTFALLVAMALNRGLRGLTVYRAIFYLPSLLGGSVAIAVLWRQLFASDGLVNAALSQFGIEGPSWISHPNYSIYTLVALSVWQFGSPMIIFLAGLRQIPQDMYEAASLDGASKFRQFYKITLPLLTPVIFFTPSSRRSKPSRPSRRPSSYPAAPVGRSIRRCSTRSTSIRKPSAISAWAMPRRSPGSWW